MKKELLSPAGNMTSLKMAVYHGADAVYLGGKKFGARAFAANFTDDEMVEAIFFCHLYGVKIYVTVNTMIYETELDEVVEYIQFLYEHHVDAIIMADIGLIRVCHEKFPDLEIHASTQVHTHNIEQVKVLKDLGVKRIVLARELSLDEIKKFPVDMDIEVFIHGALCISYSGQCLFSSLLMNRSGNRGECAQICRLPFQLFKNDEKILTNGEYLLSTKDLNTSSRFQELMNSNIKSFKIEGRMKSPAYVGFMTSFYRRLMDGNKLVTKEDMKKSETLFGRGFTLGKLFSKTNQEFMNQLTSNHQGTLLGQVETIQEKKIGIRLREDLQQEDGIRFVSENKGMIVNFLYNSQGLLISDGKKGDLVFVLNKIGLSQKGPVMKTLDKRLEASILAKEEKKIQIKMSLQIEKAFLRFTISDGEHEVTIEDTCVEVANNYPLTKESVQKQFSKLGNTPFVLQEFHLDLGNHLYMDIRSMNEIRRRGIEKLIQKRVERKQGRIASLSSVTFEYDNHLELSASAWNEEQITTLLSLGIERIYVIDYNLYQKYLCEKVIYRMNRVNHKGKYPNVSHILLGESGGLSTSFSEISLDYSFNIANHASACYWMKYGVKQMCLSPELSFSELDSLLQKYPKGNPFELIVYGRLEAMVLNHCIVAMNQTSSKMCQACKGNDKYFLQDCKGKKYPIWMDENHRTHLMYSETMSLLSELKTYYQMGIRKFRLEFYDETPQEIMEIISKVKKELCV